ncbi:MAG: winged helix-turn-helix domain-containing protein [Hyphomicrobium sp.]|jgi:molybdate transport system regulatory protein|nr:winged helix-turn-helix domain-containing protein [Hyphomicrobium sp.]
MTRVVLRIDFDAERYLGHGRIELLELIHEHGSIAKAAKAMGMSYKRAWYLAESINSTFSEPVVERQHGGKGGGSALLTQFGVALIKDYRDMEAITLKACAAQLRRMQKKLGAASDFQP